MLRLLLLICLTFGVFCTPAGLQAAETRSYAPDNLSQLSYPQRVKVIEKEYYEQSRGRTIPDDQLEFYLDSIESGWSFNRIKQDIATSLGSNNAGNWNPGGNWSPVNIICSSVKSNYQECRTPFGGRAILTQQISDTRCKEGHNWGQRQGLIWVDHGCRASFSEIKGGSGWDNGNVGGSNVRVTCESNGSAYRECRTNFRGPAQLYKKLSNSSCDFNRDWGTNQGYVWVRNGCRAEFNDSYGNNGNNNIRVTCESSGSTYRECRTNFSGLAKIYRKLSSSSCDLNRDWGTRPGYVWVNNGCRAEFTDSFVGNGNNGGNGNYSVTCSANNNNFTTCAWDSRFGTPKLIQQLSAQACISGRTWGYDMRGIWVGNGCAARFGPQ